MDSLSTMYIEESPVIIWQNADGVRNVKKARIASIDLLSSSLVLRPLIEGQTENFEKLAKDLTLYFIGESKNIVFKQVNTLKILDREKVLVEIPDIVKMQEKRVEQRIVLDPDTGLSGEIYPGGRTDKSVISTLVDIKDVSLSGMGVYISKKQARFFYEQDKIKIGRIGSYRFGRPIYGVIAYIVEESGNTTHLRVGIRFVDKLNEGILLAIST